jgi:hypothetical protein
MQFRQTKSRAQQQQQDTVSAAGSSSITRRHPRSSRSSPSAETADDAAPPAATAAALPSQVALPSHPLRSRPVPPIARRDLASRAHAAFTANADLGSEPRFLVGGWFRLGIAGAGIARASRGGSRGRWKWRAAGVRGRLVAGDLAAVDGSQQAARSPLTCD